MEREKLYYILTGNRNKPGESQIYVGDTDKAKNSFCTVPTSLLESLLQYNFCTKDDNEINTHSDSHLTDKGKKFVNEYSIYGLRNFSPQRKTEEQRRIEREIEQMPDPDE